MKALLIVAHGSRRKQSNAEVVNMAEQITQSNSVYHIVHAGFLEIAAPLIPDGIQQCIDEGATSIVVLPYFLNSGRHVVDDIPRIVNLVSDNFPEIDIKIAPHLGSSPLMTELLMSCANRVQ